MQDARNKYDKASEDVNIIGRLKTKLDTEILDSFYKKFKVERTFKERPYSRNWLHTYRDSEDKLLSIDRDNLDKKLKAYKQETFIKAIESLENTLKHANKELEDAEQKYKYMKRVEVRNSRLRLGAAGAVVLLALHHKIFRSDSKNHALEELVKNPKLFDTMNPNYTKDQEFCLSAISQNIEVFNHINNKLIKNEEFLLKAIRIQNDILSLMIKNEKYNEILKKPSFIDKLKTIKNGSKEFKERVESLDLDNNSKKDSHKKRTPSKRTSKKNTLY